MLGHRGHRGEVQRLVADPAADVALGLDEVALGASGQATGTWLDGTWAGPRA